MILSIIIISDISHFKILLIYIFLMSNIYVAEFKRHKRIRLKSLSHPCNLVTLFSALESNGSRLHLFGHIPAQNC